MRFLRGVCVPAAVFCTAQVGIGCTVYTEPARAPVGVTVRGSVGVGGSVDESSFDLFYDTLSPYGTWIEQPVCGASFGPVWRPYRAVVGASFMPYRTGGEWVETDHGWAFATDWEWGWAPFHYGRWCHDTQLGWVWIPGTEWASSWVTYRRYDGYLWWSPMPPAGVRMTGAYWHYRPEPLPSRGRPVHVVPPARGQVRRVHIRRH